ncbi:MAG TPA: hypothetical protein VG962_02780 [Steroidobacteraceae bacterium]|nr:hypothetical protein [Steroidobacteraceae bacterium]
MGFKSNIEGLRKRMRRTPRKEEDERLMKLYLNRVELKKEFSRLQDENYRLQQQLKKSEALHGQALGRHKQLEEFFGDPGNAGTGLIFYQLQMIWNKATARVIELAQELNVQQLERERRLQLMEFNQKRQRRLAELERQILDAQSNVDAMDAKLLLLQRKLQSLNRFWHYFKRREVLTTVAPVQAEYDAARMQLDELHAVHERLAQEPDPPAVGLSVSGKRLVNTAVLAYAQQLVERLGAEGIAPLAKETINKRVQDASYGNTAAAKQLLEKLPAALKMLRDNSRDLQKLKSYTTKLRANASYRTDDDTVPMPESIGTTTVRILGNDLSQQKAEFEEVNVLLDNYWDLYSTLIH